MPSRFVLVNKADPKTTRPTDDALATAKLKARLVIAGHKDQKAGDYETEAPTASLMAHNLVCWMAAQMGWRMYFADISAAFLQGDYLPEERRVFLITPKGYPPFVQQFLQTKVPPRSRTDLFRMKKAGFGLAESHAFGTSASSGLSNRLGVRNSPWLRACFPFGVLRMADYKRSWRYTWTMSAL